MATITAAAPITEEQVRSELADKIVRRLTGMKPVGNRCKCDAPRTRKEDEHEPPCQGFYYAMAIKVVEEVAAEF